VVVLQAGMYLCLLFEAPYIFFSRITQELDSNRLIRENIFCLPDHSLNTLVTDATFQSITSYYGTSSKICCHDQPIPNLLRFINKMHGWGENPVRAMVCEQRCDRIERTQAKLVERI